MSTDWRADERLDEYLALYRDTVIEKEGTRVYVEQGRVGQLPYWVRRVNEYFTGDLVPYEWVPEYLSVSRAAVHKHVGKGRLTVLVFAVQDEYMPVVGVRMRSRTRRECKYALRSECDVWQMQRIDSELWEREDVRRLQDGAVRGWWDDEEL